MIHFVFILKKLAIEYNLITNSIINISDSRSCQ